MPIILYLLFGIATSALFTYLFIRVAPFFNLLDKPNARSSHSINTPRGAGIIFALLWFVTLCFLDNEKLPLHSSSLMFSVGGVTLLGFIDDNYPLSARLRFAVQLLCALLFLCCLPSLPPLPLIPNVNHLMPGLAWFLMLVGLVWSINLYNFMDGLDGLAALEALYLSGMGILLFYLSGAYALCYLLLSAWALVAGFLIWNWPQARVFMGDAGSYFLGFLLSAFALLGAQQGLVSLEIWIILYSLFWFDATATLLRRLYKGRQWNEPHREHAFQRLQIAGFSHQAILLGLCCINAVLALTALCAFWTGWHKTCLMVAFLLNSGIYWKIEQINPHH